MATSATPQRDFLRKRAVEYHIKFLLTPYSWGGSSGVAIDCSGLCVETLQGVGLLKHGRDYTADGLWRKFQRFEIPDKKGEAGCLAFWFKDGRAIHVEMMIDEFHTVGASGGGRPRMDYEEIIDQYPHLAKFPKWYVKTLMMREEARRRTAFVKMRPVTYRGNDYAIADPFK